MWGEGPGWSVWLSALVALLTLVYLVPKAYPPSTWTALHQFSPRTSTTTDTPARQAQEPTAGATISPTAISAPAAAASAASTTSTATAKHPPKHDAKHDVKQDAKAAPKPTNTTALEKPKDTAKDTAAAVPKRPDPSTAPSTQTRVSQACADALMRQSLDPNAGESRQTPAACR